MSKPALGLCPVCPFAIALDDRGRITTHGDCPGRFQIPLPAENWRHSEYHDNLMATPDDSLSIHG
jgi:hypothetical protein